MLNSKLFWLIVVFVLGLFSRIYLSNYFPPSLNWDEVSHGYNAYSLLKSGRDEWGFALPNIFRAFGDYKLPVYIYLTVPVYQNPRLASEIFGSISILLAGFLAYCLTNKKQMLWIMGLLIAFEPWTWFFSRIAVEANVSLTFVLLGFLLYQKRKSLAGLILFWGLAMWTYNSARIFVPAMLLLIAIKDYKELLGYLSKKWLITGLLVLGLVVPALLQTFSTTGSARFYWTTILDQGAINRINEARGASALPGIIKTVVFNKVSYFVTEATKNFLSFFSFNYWFLQGGSQYQYSVQGIGLLFGFDALWLIAGLIAFFKFRPKNLFLFIWFVVALLPASFTRDAPHPLRSVYAVFPMYFVLALGINYLTEIFNKKYVAIYLGVLILSFFGFLNVAEFYRTNYSWSWQYGYEQMFGYISSHYDKYDKIIVSKKYGEPHEFYTYYEKIDPKSFQKNKVWDYHSEWYWVNQYDKIYFVNDWEVVNFSKNLNNHKTLVVASPDSVPAGNVITKINFLDGKPAFILVEI